LDELDKLGIALLDVKSLEEFVAKLDKIVKSAQGK